MELIEGSETSAISIVTPGTYPKENILHTGHGESLKSSILSKLTFANSQPFLTGIFISPFTTTQLHSPIIYQDKTVHCITQLFQIRSKVVTDNKVVMFTVIHSLTHSLSQAMVCLMASPRTLPYRVFHRERASNSSCNFQYSPVSLRSFSSCLRLLPRLPANHILSCIFPFTGLT